MIPLFLFLFGLLGLLAWLPLIPLSALAFPFCSSLGVLAELLVERLGVGAGVFRAFWFGGWVGVLRGVFWAEFSRLGVALPLLIAGGGASAPLPLLFHCSEVRRLPPGLPSAGFGGLPVLLLGDVGSGQTAGGGSGVVGIMALLGL